MRYVANSRRSSESGTAQIARQRLQAALAADRVVVAAAPPSMPPRTPSRDEQLLATLLDNSPIRIRGRA